MVDSLTAYGIWFIPIQEYELCSVNSCILLSISVITDDIQ